jgi:hypothetical protein
VSNECPHCNTHNPPQAVTCRVCNLNVPRSNPSLLTAGRALPKLAVFDLDKTVFDLTRRERAAKRQGLKPKGKGWYEFLNQNQYVLMDTAIPGTVSFIKSLSDDGYTIAYLSGRPSRILAATKQSLQESGFPIDATDRDLVFLHSGNQSSLGNLTNHKKAVLTHLKSMFDIHFFFDDTPEFREAAKSLFIPGVYSSISSYTGKEERPSAPKKTRSSKARNNPHLELLSETPMSDYDVDEYYDQEYYDKDEWHDSPAEFEAENLTLEQLMAEERAAADDIKRREERYDEEQDWNAKYGEPGDYEYVDDALKESQDEHSALVDELKSRKPELMANPPKPRKKRNKAGNMIKEPVKKYMSRFMADPKMNKEFPDNSQRFAVGLSYARKFYGDAKVDKHYPPRSNPSSKRGDKSKPVVLDTNLSSMSYTGNTKLPGRLPYQLIKKLRSLLARDREYGGFVKDNKIYYGTSHGIHGVSLEFEGHAFKDAEFIFHTHPFGFRKGMQGTISPADIGTSCGARMFGGTSWHLVIQKRGINIIRTSIAQKSDLHKALIAGNKGKWKTEKLNKTFDDLFNTDMKVISNMYNPKKPYRGHIFDKEMKVFHPDWNASSELKQEEALINTCDKFVKGFNFDMWYLEVPSEHSDWSKEMTEHFPLDEKSFSDVADYFKGYKQIRSNPRSNPHNPVTEAKEMYEQFHKKAPSNVKKTKVDIGDTWVGLGKAWSIGYRSGKETGNETQKYIHNFGVDEESGKKFKEPELYYVKNKDGSQMMVIMGGDWYIDVDADGEVSWIYV